MLTLSLVLWLGLAQCAVPPAAAAAGAVFARPQHRPLRCEAFLVPSGLLCPARAVGSKACCRRNERCCASRLRCAAIGSAGAGRWACRAVGEVDLDAVCELDRACYGEKGLWTRDMYLDDIKSANTDVIGLFNVGGERGHPARRLVGVASLGVVLDEASITSMCVSPEVRGRGLGEALMVGLMQVLAAHAAESICLEVRAESNAPAVALYRKFGFEEVGRRKGYYKRPPEDAIIMFRSAVSLPDLVSWTARLSSKVIVNFELNSS